MAFMVGMVDIVDLMGLVNMVDILDLVDIVDLVDMVPPYYGGHGGGCKTPTCPSPGLPMEVPWQGTSVTVETKGPSGSQIVNNWLHPKQRSFPDISALSDPMTQCAVDKILS